MYASIAPWEVSTYYPLGSIVIYDNTLYKCNTTHTSDSTSFDTDGANWDLLSDTVKNWAVNKYYYSGQLVVYSGCLYRCTTGNISTTTFDDVKSNFELVIANIQVWKSSMFYHVGSIVLYDGVLYRCTTEHTSTSTWDATKWDFVFANIRQYANNTSYKAGSEVVYNKNLYRCLEDHVSTTEDDIKGTMLFYSSGSTFIVLSYGQTPSSYTLDLGEIKNITEVSFNFGGIYLSFEDVTIDVSEDNVDFTNVYHIPNAHTLSGNFDAHFYASARYIKITVNSLYWDFYVL